MDELLDYYHYQIIVADVVQLVNIRSEIDTDILNILVQSGLRAKVSFFSFSFKKTAAGIRRLKHLTG